MIDPSEWLGDTDLTPSQRAQFIEAAERYLAQPYRQDRDPANQLDHDREDDLALSAILQHTLGQGSLEEAALHARSEKARLTAWVRAMQASGMSEAKIAQHSGMARETVRSRLGKGRAARSE